MIVFIFWLSLFNNLNQRQKTGAIPIFFCHYSKGHARVEEWDKWSDISPETQNSDKMLHFYKVLFIPQHKSFLPLAWWASFHESSFSKCPAAPGFRHLPEREETLLLSMQRGNTGLSHMLPVSVLALGLYTNSTSQISQARFFTYADKTTCMLQKYSFSLKVFATSHPIFWSYEYYLAMTISENPDPKLMLDSCHCYLHCFIEKYE